MLRQVVINQEVDVVDTNKTRGYLMKGDKGDFILTRNVDGKFIFARVLEGCVSKPVNEYDSIQEALEDKIKKGYTIFEYVTLSDLSNALVQD